MADILTHILAEKAGEVEKGKSLFPQALLEDKIGALAPALGFAHHLEEAARKRGAALIAELKKASPSKGVMREDFHVPDLARDCEKGGCDAFSVLTDQIFFKGAGENIALAKRETNKPVLRKDFIIDSWQIYESRAFGADAILLIASALTDEELAEFEEVAFSLELDVLVEAHDEAELARALRLKTPLVGINSRNLKNFTTQLDEAARLVDSIPKDKFAIAESGLKTGPDIQLMREKGARAFLIGETIMRHPSVQSAVEELTAHIQTAQQNLSEAVR